MLAFAGRWVEGFFGDATATVGLVIGIVVGLAVFGYAAVTYYLFERNRRRRGHGDVEEMTVQEIRVTNPRVVELAMATNIEPILVLMLASKGLLSGTTDTRSRDLRRGAVRP
jgi:peptidoglycan/LPS O-acetylase OafA/YrhL